MLDVNNTVNVEGEWFINENLDLAYLSIVASEFVPSDTSTDIGSDPMAAMHALTSLHVPLKSFFMVNEKTNDAIKVFFEVPASHRLGANLIWKDRF